jgi:hypothetical protein
MEFFDEASASLSKQAETPRPNGTKVYVSETGEKITLHHIQGGDAN